MSKPRNILVTSALPYANGPIHLGHLVEYVQTDIWVRFQRLRGHCCYYICADDAHGTPVMLRAAQEGVTPRELIARVDREHRADFADFLITFDNYHSTHSPENRLLCEQIYRALLEAGLITRRTVQQAYDPERGLFLPDRYIRGRCPRCAAEDQCGDNCEVCGATYASTEIEDPRSVLSGARPEQRASEHYFFRLPELEGMLRKWVHGGHLQREVEHKLEEWFTAGLRDWDISRDAPYFGFRIPGTQDKYFYVWLDAPIGYLAGFLNLCRRRGLDFDAYLRPDSDAELYHFIGKDIVYFHGLFWPAILHAAGCRTPSALFAHGFLTVNGRKMSKTRGTFITARSYLEHLHPEYLRYYLGCRLDAGVDDIDFNLDDFRLRVNSDLVGKFVNIASRCAVLLQRHFGGRLAERLDEPGLFEETAAAAPAVAEAYEAREYARATRTVMALADRVNQYLARRKPWELARRAVPPPELQEICTTGLNCFRQLAIYLHPVLPSTAAKVQHFLRLPEWGWEDAARPQLERVIRPYKPLHLRVKAAAATAMLRAAAAAGEEPPAPVAAASGVAETPAAPLPAKVGIDDFARLDLRVARIAAARPVADADRLLRLELDLGTEQRTVLAGIRRAYRPQDLEGRLTVVVANLEPRRMRFGVSEGMVLAAGDDGEGIFLLSPDAGARPGMKIR